jgi:protein-disulfide isomerase
VKTGKVRFGYQHYAFLGPESQWAAEASECAAEQEAFWRYHDRLYDRQAGENRGAFSQDNLKQFAVELGLDSQAFNACLASGKYAATVRADTAAGESVGVKGTPAFLVNGRPLVGALPFEAFRQTIETELAAGKN